MAKESMLIIGWPEKTERDTEPHLETERRGYPGLLPDDIRLAKLWRKCPPGFPFVHHVPWVEDQLRKYDS